MSLSSNKIEIFDNFIYRAAEVYTSINKNTNKENWKAQFINNNDFGRLKTLRLLYLAWLEPNFPEKLIFNFGPYGDFEYIERDILNNYSMFKVTEDNPNRVFTFEQDKISDINQTFNQNKTFQVLDDIVSSLHSKKYLTNTAYGLKEAILYETTYIEQPRLYVKNIDY